MLSALVAVRVKASIVWSADRLAGAGKLAVWGTGNIEIALLAELFEAVVGKLLVCVDVWVWVQVRVRLCGVLVKLGHFVRRGLALRRAVAVVRAVGATQGLWIDVFSLVLVARCRGLGWFQLAFGLSAMVADIIRIALAASERKHGIKETFVQSWSWSCA